MLRLQEGIDRKKAHMEKSIQASKVSESCHQLKADRACQGSNAHMLIRMSETAVSLHKSHEC